MASSSPLPPVAMSETRTIPIASLLLDLENPRLAQGPHNQREALQAMLRAEGRKTLELAKDISQRGLNPSERLMVTPSEDDSQRLIVLEGNRRLAALRLLSEPKQHGDGLLKAPTLKRLETWSRSYQQRAQSSVECTVFPTRAEANPWIELRHAGEAEGVGLVRWGTIEQMRFNSRQNSVNYPELQVLDFVAEHAQLDESTREKLHDFPITNLQRLVDDAEVRKRLGFDVDAQKRLVSKLPDAELAKGLTKAVRDIASGEVKVENIYDASKRRTYLDTFKRGELPDVAKAGPKPRIVLGNAVTASRGKGASASTRQSSGRVAALRKGMAPSKCKLEITNPRIARIYRELQLLRVDDFPNAAAVLFRVFLELTTDEYTAINRLQLAAGQRESLGAKLSLVAGDLQQRGVLTKHEIKALNHAAGEKRVVGANIVTFHAYVHNKDFAPLAVDLRSYWDNLQPFFEKVWSK